MEERLEYRLYCMRGDLEKLKYDYEMEYRKIDWMNRRTDMYRSRMKISGQVIITTILVMIALFWGNRRLQSDGGNLALSLIKETVAFIMVVADILLVLLVVLPWLFALLKNLRLYLKSGNGYGSHLYSVIRGKDNQLERKAVEANIYVMSNKIIQMEFEIEQLAQQVGEKRQKEAAFMGEGADGITGKFAETGTGMLGADSRVNYEEEDIKNKSCAEIQSHLYYLEGIERNLQKQYDREYSITCQIEDQYARPEHYIRKAVVMFCCGLGGVLISSAIKVINLITIHNKVIFYGSPILGIGFVFVLVLPSGFMIVKELIMRYINSEKFWGKEYVDQIKNVSKSAKQVENEKTLTEVSKKLARVQAEKQELEELLQKKLESEGISGNEKISINGMESVIWKEE